MRKGTRLIVVIFVFVSALVLADEGKNELGLTLEASLPKGARNPARHTHTGTAQFGVGVDIRTRVRVLAPITLRGEFRDFYALNALNYTMEIRDDRQHHLVVAGGFMLRF